jgi:hypothetical protein
MPKPTEDGLQKDGRNDKRHDIEVWSPNRKTDRNLDVKKDY